MPMQVRSFYWSIMLLLCQITLLIAADGTKPITNKGVVFAEKDGGGDLKTSNVKETKAGSKENLGTPPSDTDQDWLVVVQKK